MAAGQHDRGVSVGGLAPADGADEDGVVEHALGEGGLEGELVLSGPLGVLGLVDAGPLDEVGEGEGAGGSGDVEGRLGGQADEGAELAREGRRDLVEGERDFEDAAVGRVAEIWRVDHGAAQALDLAQVALLEPAEVVPRIL